MRADQAALTACNDLAAIIDRNEDEEAAHANADTILVNFIRAIGYDDVARAWEAIQPKWYA